MPGMDLEMIINEHYYECLDMFSELFVYIFENLNLRYSREIEAVRAQHPFEDLKVCVCVCVAMCVCGYGTYVANAVSSSLMAWAHDACAIAAWS